MARKTKPASSPASAVRQHASRSAAKTSVTKAKASASATATRVAEAAPANKSRGQTRPKAKHAALSRTPEPRKIASPEQIEIGTSKTTIGPQTLFASEPVTFNGASGALPNTAAVSEPSNVLVAASVVGSPAAEAVKAVLGMQAACARLFLSMPAVTFAVRSQLTAYNAWLSMMKANPLLRLPKA
jgi:hypothetical protein